MSWKNAPAEKGRPHRPWSLATRLTIWYAGSAFLLVLLATGFLYAILALRLEREADRTLADQANILRGLLRDRPEDPAALRQEVEWEWAARQYALVYARILDEDGHVLMETPGMSDVLPAEQFPPAAGTEEAPGPGTMLRSPTGQPFRAIAARGRAELPGRPVRIIQVALDRSEEEDLLAGYRLYLWIVLGAALVVSALVGHQIARRGIRPVRDITETAGRIRSTTLDERLELARLPAELRALAATFNDMLDRLEGSFTRLTRFSADIAHELRTPLNNLRGEAEVALSKPRSPEEYRDVLGSCLEEYERLSRMIDSLLFLARAENPETQVVRERVDLGRELTALREFYEAAAAEGEVTLTLKAEDRLTADLDRTLFQRAVGNLVENALAYTGPGGEVAISAGRESGAVCVAVTDTGRGIPDADLPHLFDRFYRVDHARAAGTGGVGLGLAIVKSIAELHGGSTAITSAVGRGTCVRLYFPAAEVPGERVRERPVAAMSRSN
jgi:two-component system heavy metal sensor histidine kinase CusS